MKLSLDLKTTLTQTLTPQQIQYLKLLQLPLIQLEQQVTQEIEQNPMLDEFEIEAPLSESESDSPALTDYTNPMDDELAANSEKAKIDDNSDPFEFYKMLWQDDNSTSSRGKQQGSDDDDQEYFQLKDDVSHEEDIQEQFQLLGLSPVENLLGEQIIGNVDSDGYLRRPLEEIVTDTNTSIAEVNIQIQLNYQDQLEKYQAELRKANPAKQYAISEEARALVDPDYEAEDQDGPPTVEYLSPVSMDLAEDVLKKIQALDPPGYASRNIRECLTAQLKALPKRNAAQKLSLQILEETYEAFTMKHYNVIIKQLGVTQDYLKEAIDEIRRLNPKPGGGDSSSALDSIIPDFIIERDEESGELIINVNDSRLPALRLNKAYEKLKKEARLKVFNKETREWIRSKYEDAKFLIQAIRQRKSTMLKVMTAIAGLQRAFFEEGPNSLRPLIYKNVSEDTGLDISTVCRIVNGKYVQTQFGTFELKFFFSESLPSDDGEEVSTRVIKQIIKDIIDSEPKNKPYSDEKIGKELKEKGYKIARRTVAKYREQMKIPVARLRKEL